MKKSFRFIVSLILLLSLCLTPIPVSATNQNFDYYVGTGIADITGPAAEIVTMGYADSNHTLEGIHMRLWARSFVVKDKQTQQKVAFVSADLGQLFQSVKEGVMKELHSRGYNDYTHNNVMLSATHSHSGPGGYAYHGLYNVSTWGFIEDNYNTIVRGIAHAIIEADTNLEPGYLEVNTGHLEGISANRSQEAYNNNPQALRSQYNSNVDTTMTVLNLKNSAGQLLGVFNWFAVHAVSMSQRNHLLSGDNKGTASYLYEQVMNTDYTSSKTFVAGFSQANCGDITPNVNLDGTGLGANDFESSYIAGNRQFLKAKELSDTATMRLTGSIDFRHQFVDMRYKEIAAQYTDGQVRATYPATMGYSFAAGTEDGRTNLPVFFEGMTSDVYTYDGAPNFVKIAQGLMTLAPKFSDMSGIKYPELWTLHYPKPVLFAPSMVKPDPWTPQIIPMQMFKLGQFSLLAVPSEFTTMAGRILKKDIKDKLNTATGQDHVVALAGLSNSYSSYVTTPHEYDQQHYEGGSTQFGRWTLAQYRQVFDQLASAILDGTSVTAGPTPPDLSDEQQTFQTGVIFDNVPPFKDFGDIKYDANSAYNKGNTVSVTFWGGHPKNDLRTGGSYLFVQRLENGSWKNVAYDWDLATKMYWIRESTLLGYSFTKIDWTIPADAPSGTYRIVHNGAYKTITGNIYQYQGSSRAFTVY